MPPNSLSQPANRPASGRLPWKTAICPASGRGVFEAIEGGSRFTSVEHVNGKHWWMRPFVPGYLKRQQKLYMDDLLREVKRVTGKTAAP